MKKEKNLKKFSNKGGITLIALIITIIVMLILAAVSISIAVNGGLFNYSSRASQEHKIEQYKEAIWQAQQEAAMAAAVSGNTSLTEIRNLVADDSLFENATVSGIATVGDICAYLGLSVPSSADPDEDAFGVLTEDGHIFIVTANNIIYVGSNLDVSGNGGEEDDDEEGTYTYVGHVQHEYNGETSDCELTYTGNYGSWRVFTCDLCSAQFVILSSDEPYAKAHTVHDVANDVNYTAACTFDEGNQCIYCGISSPYGLPEYCPDNPDEFDYKHDFQPNGYCSYCMAYDAAYDESLNQEPEYTYSYNGFGKHICNETHDEFDCSVDHTEHFYECILCHEIYNYVSDGDGTHHLEASSDNGWCGISEDCDATIPGSTCSYCGWQYTEPEPEEEP